MSRSDYKNICEGYLDNTGYNNRNIRERYGGCGSEPTPYMMNENQITEDYGNYNKTLDPKYLSLPDCGQLGEVQQNWTDCNNGKQTIKYKFTMNKKPNTNIKYNYADEGSPIDSNPSTSCKIPLPPGISPGYENKITSYFGWGDENNMNERVMFENTCSGTPNSTQTCTQTCNGSIDTITRTAGPCSDNAVGKKITTFVPTPNNGKVTYKNPVTVEDPKCRVENKTNWVKDAWGTICPLNDYVHTNYYKCLKTDGGVDEPEVDGKSRERCCKSNVSGSGYCKFQLSPCKSYPWGRSIAYNSAVNDLGGVQYGYAGMAPKNTGESCTSDLECKYGCRATGKCG